MHVHIRTRTLLASVRGYMGLRWLLYMLYGLWAGELAPGERFGEGVSALGWNRPLLLPMGEPVRWCSWLRGCWEL